LKKKIGIKFDWQKEVLPRYLFEEDISNPKNYYFFKGKIKTLKNNRIIIGMALLEIEICSTQIDFRIAR
jgi:hypothetical protein